MSQIIITRGDGRPADGVIDTTKLDYGKLSPFQFSIYARESLKESLYDYLLKENGPTDIEPHMQEINSFFETMPSELLIFDNEESIRLLLKFIVSNFQMGIGIVFEDRDRIFLYNLISSIASKRVSRK